MPDFDGHLSSHIPAQPSASRPDDREEEPLLRGATKLVHELYWRQSNRHGSRLLALRSAP
jgi:hypothetical protein